MSESSSRPVSVGLWTRAIALLEIVGGVIGLTLLVYSAFATGADPIWDTILFAPNGLAVYAGFLLWKGRRRGYTLSITLQAVQLVRITTAVFFYEFMLGLGVTIGYTNGRIFFYPKAGAEGWIGITNTSLPFSIGINLVAVFGLIYLWRRYKQIRSQSVSNEKVLTAEKPAN